MNWKSLAAAAALCLVATGLAAQPPVLIFPQVASGSGIDIEILLSNPATTENRGTLSFRDQTGNPLSLRIDGSLEDSVSFSIPAGGLLKITTEGDGELRSGYATVHSEAPESKLAGTLVFNLNGMEVSVPGAAPGGRAHITAEIDEDVDTAVALANPGDDPIDVILRLIDESGDLVEQKVVDLEPGQRDALFVSEIFSNAGEFSRGTVHAVSAQHFGMLGLRQRQSGSLVAMGSSPEVLGAILQPFGTVTVDPGFDLNGIGKNIDSPGFWEGPDPEKTLLFVSAKSNELVEVWEFPFVDNELPAL